MNIIINIGIPTKHEPINIMSILVYVSYQIVKYVVERYLHVYITGQVDTGRRQRRRLLSCTSRIRLSIAPGF